MFVLLPYVVVCVYCDQLALVAFRLLRAVGSGNAIGWMHFEALAQRCAWHCPRLPLSLPMLLAALMAVWSLFFARHCGLPHGIYVDDRCLWDSGPDAAENVAGARAVALVPDLAFDFVQNSKAQAMAATAASRLRLCALLPATVRVLT